MILPLEIQSNILSFLSFDTLENYLIFNKLPIKLILYAIKQKMPNLKMELIIGLGNNHRGKCFKCENNLNFNYNLLLCNKCCIYIENNKRYGSLCNTCSPLNLNRGEIKLEKCLYCNNFCNYYGITPLS